MADRIQQIVGIIFALAFVAILAMINTNVLNFGQSINNQLQRTNMKAETYELEAFNGTTVTGATVISTINNYKTLTEYELKIEVTNIGETAPTIFGVGGHSSYKAYKAENPEYSISPISSYDADLKTNDNGLQNTIVFIQTSP